MRKIRDILVLALVAIPLLLFVLINHLVFVIGDLLGLTNLFARIKIKRSYEPEVRRFRPEELERRKNAILQSFASQGYRTDERGSIVVTANGVFGARFEHETAKNTKTQTPKIAYYLEGTPYEQGRFLGLLAPNEIERMSVDYVDNVIFDFAAGIDNLGFWGNILADFLYFLSRRNDAMMPRDLSAEIYGMYEGTRHKGKKSRVKVRDLYVLNYGVDILLGYVYAGVEPILKLLGIKIKDFRPPLSCNAFALKGPEAGGRHFFGRDFMFPTCNVYNEVVAHIVHRPVSDGKWFEREHKNKKRFRALGSKAKSLPETIISLSAPGMVGSVTALNTQGLSMGLDMLAGRNSNWRKVGLNSLCMVRYAVSWSKNASELVDLVTEAPRGITWLYPFAHGPSGVSGVIEAGMKSNNTDYLRYTPKELRDILPSQAFLRDHQTVPFRKGIFVRFNNYEYRGEYFGFNQKLFEKFKKPFDPSLFAERDCLTKEPHTDFLPQSYYFAPQRETNPNLFVTTNLAVTPEARLLAMNEWTNLVPEMGKSFDDFQWRYDRLNKRALDFIEAGPVDFSKAKDIINFLRPYNSDGSKAEYFFYYGIKDGKELPVQDIQVGGSISCVDLLSLYIESLYGQYSDSWVGLSLRKIIDAL